MDSKTAQTKTATRCGGGVAGITTCVYSDAVRPVCYYCGVAHATATRRADLAEAQRMSALGEHDAARALFAKHGIDYHTATTN